MANLLKIIAVLSACTLTACQTGDAQLAAQGRSESYITGFHDGRHSGMKEAGNSFEHYIRDSDAYAKDADYKAGWDAGEREGERIQQQASAIGNAAAGAMIAHDIEKAINNNDADKVAKDAVKGIDTSDLKALENQ